MCKTKDGKTKVSIAEAVTTGSLGKTSATGLAGMSLLGVSIVLFVALIIFYFFNIGQAEFIVDMLDRVLVLASIAAATLGVRKISGVIASNKASSMIRAIEDSIKSDEEKAEE